MSWKAFQDKYRLNFTDQIIIMLERYLHKLTKNAGCPDFREIIINMMEEYIRKENKND